MIYVGIDDTDTLESRGTNRLARDLAEEVASDYVCLRIVRHQLLDDPRVPYTSKNGCASLVFEARREAEPRLLFERLLEAMRRHFIPGSDPGLCVAAEVPPTLSDFGRRCQYELVRASEARDVAAAGNVLLIGIGGTEDGVIGAVAAVGLAAVGNDGRVVYARDWGGELSGRHPITELARRGVEVRALDSGELLQRGMVDVGKKLRPNWRGHRCVLFARPCADQEQPFPSDALSNDSTTWQAVKLR